MDIGYKALRRRLIAIIEKLELQIYVVTNTATAQMCEPEELKDANGNFVLAPLLIAYTQALVALQAMPNLDSDRE